MKKILLYTLLLLAPLVSFADGNGSMSNVYTLSACGLNYITATHRLGQRFSPVGDPQPAAFVISGIPACVNVTKAFLYADASGNGIAETATIQGPAGTQSHGMTLIGVGADKCWGYQGSYSYRADVTSSIVGNGTYNISGLTVGPYNPQGNDIDGATLIVFYSDPTATWQGTIIFDDGSIVGNNNLNSHTMTFAAPCSTPTDAQAFMAIGDIQYPNETILMNNVPVAYVNDWWNFFSVPTTLTPTQTSALFSINSAPTGDCYNMVFTGIYYRTTGCVPCVPPPPMATTMDSTKTTCDSCNGTATVHPVGGAPPYTFSWAPSGGTDSTATNLCPGTYTVTVTGNCSSATAIVHIVQGPGGFTISNTQTNPECNGYCDGIINLSVTGGVPPFTYAWTPNVSTGASANNLCAGTYTVVVTDSNHCINNSPITITEPAPTPPPTPDNTAFCQFGPSSPLTATPSTPGDVIRWWDAATGGNFSLTAPTPSTATTGTFTWYISDVTPLGCESVRVPITVTIKPKPLFPVVNSYTYCQYVSDNVVHLAAQGDSIQWYTTPTGGVGTFTAPLPAVDTFGTTIWYVTQTVDGCESDRAPQVVRVNPGVKANFGYDLILGCGRDTLNLTDSSLINGTESVSWDFGDGSPFENFVQNPQHLYYNTGTYSVKLVVSNGFCSDSAIKDVYAFVLKELPLAVSAGVTICPGDSAQLHAYGDPSYIYNWTPPMWIKNSNTADPVVTPQNNLVYTASALDTNGCVHTGLVRVQLASNAIISIPDSVTLYPGDSYQINPQGNCLYFSWFPPSGLSADNIANPIATPQVSTRYVVHAATEWGCKTTDSIDVFVDPTSVVDIPNAFTPGGAGNREFKVVKRGLATLNYLRVYDRWGVMVYEGKDINKGWDGTYKGKPQPFGVYVYVVEAVTNTGRVFTKQGNVTLLR